MTLCTIPKIPCPDNLDRWDDLTQALPRGMFQAMANVKTTSYVDAVNRMARDAMLADLKQTMVPLADQMANLIKIMMELEGRMHAVEEQAARDHQILQALRDYFDHREGGAPYPQGFDAT